jgi:CRISPR-associated protein Csd2
MNHRYEFIYLFDVKDANPNGDPDAGNLPRVDVETGHGLLTDVCLKRKVRDYLHTTGQARIYVRSNVVLNTQNNEAWETLLPDTKKNERNKLPKDALKAMELTRWMCRQYFDIRTFGAVMSNEINCGQVRGAVQIAFSRSIDPIMASEHAITVCAARKEDKPAEEQIGIQGRKFTVPYALYRTHGFINPFLADDTGFDANNEDLELFFTALENAFQFDASAARPAGSMSPRALLVFRHDGTDSNPEQREKQAKLGGAPSHKLFERLKIVSFEKEPATDGKPPRDFMDYASKITFFDGTKDVLLDEFISPPNGKPTEKDLTDFGFPGITLIRRI